MSESFHVEALIFVIILVVYVLTSDIIETKRIPYVHQSSIAMLLGLLTAILSKYTLGKEIYFSNELFFDIILPPIIFSAGYSLRKSLFFDNLAIIGFLGIVSTIFSFILIASFISLLNSIFSFLSFSEILILSSILTATDTITAISLIKAQKFPVLHSVLFGQGILNDAVSIMLFGIISKLQFLDSSQFTLSTVARIAFQFLYHFFFSITLGTVSGLGLSYLLKKNPFLNQHPIKEISLILLNGYLTYLLGEIMGLSGIITLFVCATIMGHYSFMNISHESQKGTGLAFQAVSYISEAFIFTYLGASVLSIYEQWFAVLIAILILLCLPVVRALILAIIPTFYHLLKLPFILTIQQLKVCWYSGIIRGVIAFALCLQVDSPHKTLMVNVTVIIVFVTSLTGSSYVQLFANWIGLKPRGEKTYKQTMIHEKNTLPQDWVELKSEKTAFEPYEKQNTKPLIRPSASIAKGTHLRDDPGKDEAYTQRKMYRIPEKI